MDFYSKSKTLAKKLLKSNGEHDHVPQPQDIQTQINSWHDEEPSCEWNNSNRKNLLLAREIRKLTIFLCVEF